MYTNTGKMTGGTEHLSQVSMHTKHHILLFNAFMTLLLLSSGAAAVYSQCESTPVDQTGRQQNCEHSHIAIPDERVQWSDDER